MKPQDILFGVVFLILFAIRRPVVFFYAGVFSLILSMPLFTMQVFFTAERLTWYSAFFFLCSVIFSFIRAHKVK
jgi:hypothetical protein